MWWVYRIDTSEDAKYINLPNVNIDVLADEDKEAGLLDNPPMQKTTTFVHGMK